MKHIFLLGDSIFDNAAYVAGGPHVVQQLRQILPVDFRASLLAVDGAVTESVHRQLERVTLDATHLVISVGGNDALRSMSVLSHRVASVAEALARIADIGEVFQRHYKTMLEAALRFDVPVFIYTIYDPRFPDVEDRRIASAGLTHKSLNAPCTEDA